MPYTVSHCRLRRIFRVGACPVLEITVTYPCLRPNSGEMAELPPSVCRFNRAYEQMAEGVLRWGEGAPREAAEAAFRAAGDGAAYRFDRRTVVCEMTAACTEGEGADGGGWLRVTRTLEMGSRRGEIPSIGRAEADCWRLPALTLAATRKKAAPIAKN